jgi:CRISPR/Cas system-associated exonuclease Cas4 (RecB family)
MARANFTNDFSWSKSRHDKFTECPRAYYFHYYRSWGGWEPGAPPEVRELYVLKKLSSRYSWAGSVVHDAIRDALLNWKERLPVDGAKVVERALELMREDFRHSRTRGYRTRKYRKQFSGLVEHEYEEPVTDEEWRQNAETVRAALGWFFGSRWPELARHLGPEQWLEVDAGASFSFFTLEGVKVFAIPDFAYVEADGTPVVVDWKTGRVREGYDEQVLGYALYLSQRHRLPLEKVRASLVYLNEGREQQVRVDASAVEGFKSRFAQSVARMRELLADPAANTPREEAAFPPTEDRATCARCAFRRPCGREAAARVA